MTGLNCWVEYTETEANSIYNPCVAIKTLSPSQRHIGIIIGDDELHGKILHVFDEEMKLEKIEDEYCWVVIEALEERAEVIFDMLYVLHEENRCGEIPFGFSEILEIFEEGTGKYLGNQKGISGISCSTFVLSALSYCSVPLIESQTWLNAIKEDIDWKLEIISDNISVMESRPGYEERLRADLDARRFRPEEIVAAADLFQEQPITCHKAKEHSVLILSEYQKYWDSKHPKYSSDISLEVN